LQRKCRCSTPPYAIREWHIRNQTTYIIWRQISVLAVTSSVTGCRQKVPNCALCSNVCVACTAFIKWTENREALLVYIFHIRNYLMDFDQILYSESTLKFVKPVRYTRKPYVIWRSNRNSASLLQIAHFKRNSLVVKYRTD